MLLNGTLEVEEHQDAPLDLGVLGNAVGGVFSSQVRSISHDGSTTVGNGVNASGREATRWTTADGLEGLGDLPGGSFDSAALTSPGMVR